MENWRQRTQLLLGDEVVNLLVEDAGNIWIGTIGNGLIKFDTNTSHFISLKMYCSRTSTPSTAFAMTTGMCGWELTTVCFAIT